MNKDKALKLHDKAVEVGKIYSNPTRQYNGNAETFELTQVNALSENVGYAIYRKEPTEKKVLVVFLWVVANDGFWLNFIPTDSHLLGWEKLKEIKFEIETFNFGKN